MTTSSLRLVAIASTVTVGLGLLVGCTRTQPGSENPDFVVATRPATDDTGSDSAIFSGELIVINGCLAVDDGEQTVIPVFSDVDPRLKGLAVGQKVDLAGGAVDTLDSSVPANCQDASTYWSVAAENS